MYWEARWHICQMQQDLKIPGSNLKLEMMRDLSDSKYIDRVSYFYRYLKVHFRYCMQNTDIFITPCQSVTFSNTIPHLEKK